MAVPFNIPEDQNEVEVIINQFQSLLVKLQAAVRRSREPTTRTNEAIVRVRSPASTRLRSRDEPAPTNSVSTTNFPDLINNLAWLAAASQDAASSSSSSLTTNALTRSPRRRTNSESSNCDETKISITAIVNHEGQDWNQVGVTLGKIADDFETDSSRGAEREQGSSASLLSKFVPGPVSAPLWTAMICFVGWHLFRAR